MYERNLALIQLSDFGLGRGLYLTRALLKLNFRVMVITTIPIYSISEGSISIEEVGNKADIILMPLPRLLCSLHGSIICRIITYVGFMFYAFLALLRRKPDIIYSRGPHPFTDIISILYMKFNGKAKIISDITDLWPDALEYTKLDQFTKKTLILMGTAINAIIYPHLDVIVTHNELMAEVLRIRSRQPVYVLRGVLDLERFRPLDKKDLVLPQNVSEFVRDKFVVLYAGLLGYFQNPHMLVDLAETIFIEGIKDIVVLIVGDGPLKSDLERKAKELSLSNIKFVVRVPHEEMIYFYNVADVCLLPYAPINFLAIGLPKKFIEYAACGKPIICVTPHCVASSLALAHEAGFHVEHFPEAIPQLMKIVVKLKKDVNLRNTIAKNSRLMAEELFSIENGTRILETVIKGI